MRSLLLTTSLLLTGIAFAQPYAIGGTNVSFFDAERGRDVTCEMHYPATADGTDTPVATGTFATLVIGHGFVMGVDAYEYIWRHFTPLGYIVMLPTTEADFTPDHAEFGADLAFLVNALQVANLDAGSPFFGHVSASAALMGHSMGGGAAVLGAAAQPPIQALLLFAPAETDPSAIAAAANVTVPSLVFAASEDCVTPLAAHAQPIHDALTVPCKALVNITGGGHCYFGDDNFLCSFGEITCAPDLTITREEQHDIVLDLAGLWLEDHLQGSLTANAALADSLASSTRFVANNGCLTTSVSLPSPASPVTTIWDGSGIRVCGAEAGSTVLLMDPLGRLEASAYVRDGCTVLVPGSAQGLHLIMVQNGSAWSMHRIVNAQ